MKCRRNTTVWAGWLAGCSTHWRSLMSPVEGR